LYASREGLFSVQRSARSGSPLTIPSLDVPDLDIGRIAATYRQRVRGTRPDLLPMASQLLERLPPDRWMLEWHLPWWLGHAFGLPGDVAGEIVLSNVFGLGSVRLQDDVADGEVPRRRAGKATQLAETLYDLALEPYRARFAVDSTFWAHLGRCMATWRDATGAEGRLAARGAPLKISAFGVSLLSGREDAYPTLDRLLDEALEALVLYDHIADWQADLDAGRWNAYVAELSEGPQVASERTRHRRTVLVAMMTTDVVAIQVGRVQAGLLRAADLGDTLSVPVPRLVAHLRVFARQVGEDGRTIQAHYRDLGDRAAKLLFDRPSDGRS
jgi:hypothetical protein